MADLFQYPFMRSAFEVGTLVAVLAGAVGYFVVLRGQTFAAHMVAQVGFPGAAAAVLLNVSPVVGMAVFCVAAALALGAGGRDGDPGRRSESALVGGILAFGLGLGLLFFRIYRGSSPQAVYGFLFGGILGITERDVLVTLVVATVTLAALVMLARPLLFASVDAGVAESRGVPVRALGAIFLVVLALSVAAAVQVAGTLLVFALLVTPAAAALQVTARPGPAVALTIALSLLFTWSGLALAYGTGYPVGFVITTVAFVTYGGVRLGRAARPRRRAAAAA